MPSFTPYHSQYLANRIMLDGVDQDAFVKSLSTARVDMNPHQVDAALFAMECPISRGVLLADEVGLGKTIEAALVIAQRWAERQRRILLIVPASLRKQWTQELREKFSLPSIILETKIYKEHVKRGHRKPFDQKDHIIVTSYEFAALKADDIAAIKWDLVIFDEAHRLRNVYKKGTAVRAKALRQAVRPRYKILLTATPLQNSLMELYGLATIIDEHLFGDEGSFKTLYGGAKPTTDNLMILRDRIKPICRRTLRRDVQEAGHINYTKRIATTFRFEPGNDENSLYNSLSAYLQRPDTVAFGARPNQLVILIIRKILGSSTFAVTQTLNTIIERLKSIKLPTIDDMTDIESAEDEAEEWDSGDTDDTEDASPDSPQVDPVKVKAEIEELTRYRDLAVRIPINAKGEQLVATLPGVLDEIVARGGQRKAVIFTESVRTQRYLAELLGSREYSGQIVLLNGTNSDPESQAIYANWIARNKGTDATSGSKSADMKAAIVDAFRNDKTIMISTESGAEGINLQFCSLIINFDLPWNPQRVEQRIGRCHRYGQKIDVTVVNLLSLKNRAEERIYELLEKKFKLFDGVFGASDEILGIIEKGVDFERRVLEIVQSARTETEINDAFDRLQQELQERIDAEMLDARRRLLEQVDENVVRRLKNRKGDLKGLLSVFERRLLTIARAELAEARFHTDGTPRFDYQGKTWTTEWPLADERKWQFFRLTDGNLASQLVDRARSRTLPLSVMTFTLDAYDGGRLSDLEALRGKSGWLRVTKLSVKTAERTFDHLLLSAVVDDGTTIEAEVVDRLFLVPATARTELGLAPPTDALDRIEQAARQVRLADAEKANASWMDNETEKLDAYAEDMEQAADTEIKALEAEIKARRKATRTNDMTVAAKIEEKRAIKKMEARRDELVFTKFERKKAIQRDIEDILDQVQESLKVTPVKQTLFVLRWNIIA